MSGRARLTAFSRVDNDIVYRVTLKRRCAPAYERRWKIVTSKEETTTTSVEVNEEGKIRKGVRVACAQWMAVCRTSRRRLIHTLFWGPFFTGCSLVARPRGNRRAREFHGNAHGLAQTTLIIGVIYHLSMRGPIQNNGRTRSLGEEGGHGKGFNKIKKKNIWNLSISKLWKCFQRNGQVNMLTVLV